MALLLSDFGILEVQCLLILVKNQPWFYFGVTLLTSLDCRLNRQIRDSAVAEHCLSLFLIEALLISLKMPGVPSRQLPKSSTTRPSICPARIRSNTPLMSSSRSV